MDTIAATAQVGRILDEAGLPLHGFCPFAEVAGRLRSCRASGRLPERAGTVIAALFPYRFAYEDARNLSRYACVPDYHQAAGDWLTRAARQLEGAFPSEAFVPFIDNSPLPEVYAAALAGLGCIGDHGLLIHPRYGSWVFIGTIVSTLPLGGAAQAPRGCRHCGACSRRCPGACIGAGRETCLSALTQKKGVLTPEEEARIRGGGLVWGCDACQEVCPLNAGAAIAPHPCFTSYDPWLSEASLADLDGKAYAWRGQAVLRRNLRLFSER